MKRFLAILAVLGLLLVLWQPGEQQAPLEEESTYRIESEEVRIAYELVDVIDGDTILVRLNGETQSVRLIGVDAPETLYSSKGEECFGAESREALDLLLPWDSVLLEFDPSQGRLDMYDRLLAYVFDPEGQYNMGEVLIREGYATEYTFKGSAYRYQDVFLEAEKYARSNDKGLWVACVD